MYLHAVFALIALLIGCGELDRTKGRGSVTLCGRWGPERRLFRCCGRAKCCG